MLAFQDFARTAQRIAETNRESLAIRHEQEREAKHDTMVLKDAREQHAKIFGSGIYRDMTALGEPRN